MKIRLDLMEGMGALFLSASPAVFCVLTFFRFYSDASFFFAILFVLHGFFLYLFFIDKVGFDSKVNVLVIFFVFSGLISAALGSGSFFGVPQSLACAGYALALLHYNINPGFYKLVYYVFVSFCFFLILQGIDPEGVFLVSRNVVSVFVVLGLSLYYIACQNYCKSPSVLPATLGVIVAMWAIGRSGMASAVFFLFYAVFFTGKRFSTKGFFVFFVLVFLYFVLAGEYFNILTVGIDRFNTLGIEDVRTLINSAYLIRVTSLEWEFFIGGDLGKIYEVISVNGNPHNSYINLHVNFGIFGFVVMVFFLFYSILKLVFLRNFTLLIVLLVCLFRSSFDVTAFYGPLDLIIWYVVFYVIGFSRVNFGWSMSRGV